MRDSFKVARWEIVKNLKSKGFIILTFFLPILILLVAGVGGYFAARTPEGLSIAVVDETGMLADSFKEKMIAVNYRVEILSPVEATDVTGVLEEKSLNGLLVIPADIFSENRALFYFKDLQGLELDYIREVLSPLVTRERLEERGYVAAEVMLLTEETRVKPLSLAEGGGIAGIFLPMGMAILMGLAALIAGSNLMQSIIKEKANRITELLLSSISPRSLMAGKILGYGTLGLIQVAV